jgi:hypothetical protein
MYNPDTDTFFIGIPLIKKLSGKSIFVQLNFFSFDSEFIDMTVLTDCLAHDLLLHCLTYLKMTVLLPTLELILLVEMLLYV